MRNISLYISRKIITSGETFTKNSIKKSSTPIKRIAIAAIALGFIMLLISFSVLHGFKKEIIQKLSGFNGDLSINSLDQNQTSQTIAISIDKATKQNIINTNYCKSIQGVANLPCIIRTKTEIEGVLLKGVEKDFDFSFYKKYLIAGSLPKLTSDSLQYEVLMSNFIVKKLKLSLGENIFFYVVKNPPRIRKLKLVGIYKTGLEDFDKLFAITNIAHVQKLNNWQTNEVSNYEIKLNGTVNNPSDASYEINRQLPFNLKANTLAENQPQIHSWLALQDINVLVILILIVLICSINLIAVLLVTILENTENIGILKSVGVTNFLIVKIFLWNALQIIGKGLIVGNIIGVGICLAQYYFHFIPLDETSYYIAYVPIDFSIKIWLLLNFCTIFLSLFILLIPAMAIAKINPIKALRFK